MMLNKETLNEIHIEFESAYLSEYDMFEKREFVRSITGDYIDMEMSSAFKWFYIGYLAKDSSGL